MKKIMMGSLLTALCSLALSTNAVEAKSIDDVTNPVELTYRTIGALTGVTFGVPLSTMQTVPKSIANNVTAIAEEFNGGATPDATQYAVATVPGAFIGLADGLVKGTITGVENGINQGFDKPFSLESFSLDE